MNNDPTLPASRPSNASLVGTVKESHLINYAILAVPLSPLKKEISKAEKDWQETCRLSQQKNNRMYVRAARFLQLVEKNFREHRQVCYYAGRINVSKDYLREICRKAIHCSPKRCIEMQIVLEGLHLLCSPMLDVGEISFRLGYKDTSQFIRIFKAHTGWTPGALRLAE